jgi:hypothetical protein
MAKVFNIISFFAGIALLAYLVNDRGAQQCWDDLTGVGWGILLPIGCAYLMMFCGSFCWLLSMKPGCLSRESGWPGRKPANALRRGWRRGDQGNRTHETRQK